MSNWTWELLHLSEPEKGTPENPSVYFAHDYRYDFRSSGPSFSSSDEPKVTSRVAHLLTQKNWAFLNYLSFKPTEAKKPIRTIAAIPALDRVLLDQANGQDFQRAFWRLRERLASEKPVFPLLSARVVKNKRQERFRRVYE